MTDGERLAEIVEAAVARGDPDEDGISTVREDMLRAVASASR